MDNLKETKEMIEYQKETGKKAIWRGNITEGFKKWQKGEKIYEKNKERVMILVSEDNKKKWQNFIKNYNITTVSKLIRQSVKFFMEYKANSQSLKSISDISHELKESLTIIKGYSQILFEEYKDKLDWDVTLKLKTIYDQSLILETKIITNLEKPSTEDSKYDILIVEDDLLTINLLIDFFNRKGYSCKSITNGTEALEELQSYNPKLILLDILLPDKSGYEICKEFKSKKQRKNIPIFYITAVSEYEVREKMDETGADGYFLKPFDFGKFDVVFSYL
ncbi:MAG: response regulator [Promethearchaeota archaeon]